MLLILAILQFYQRSNVCLLRRAHGSDLFKFKKCVVIGASTFAVRIFNVFLAVEISKDFSFLSGVFNRFDRHVGQRRPEHQHGEE